MKYSILVAPALFSLCTACGGDAGAPPSGSGATSSTSGAAGASSGAAGATPDVGGVGGSSTAGGAGVSGGAGVNSSGAGGGASGEGVGCDGAAICDKFEGGSLDKTKWTFNGAESLTPTIVSGAGRNGSAALYYSAGDNRGASIFPSAGIPTGKFHARAYVKFSKDMTEMGGHVSYMDAATKPENGVELRLGASSNFQVRELMMDVNLLGSGNEVTQFATGIVEGGDTATHDVVALLKNIWYCIEVMVDPTGEYRVWVDETEIEGLHVTDWRGHKSDWGQAWTHMKFGPHNYSGNIGEVSYDEIAIDVNRIGCD